MQPLVYFFGKPRIGYGTMVGIEDWLELVENDPTEHSNGRKNCYRTGTSVDILTAEVVEQFKLTPAAGLGENGLCAEVFWPEGDYPPHVDEGGLSAAVALNQDCSFTIEGQTINLGCFDTIVFNDGMLHDTTGPFLMIKLAG